MLVNMKCCCEGGTRCATSATRGEDASGGDARRGAASEPGGRTCRTARSATEDTLCVVRALVAAPALRVAGSQRERTLQRGAKERAREGRARGRGAEADSRGGASRLRESAALACSALRGKRSAEQAGRTRIRREDKWQGALAQTKRVCTRTPSHFNSRDAGGAQSALRARRERYIYCCNIYRGCDHLTLALGRSWR